MNGKKYAEAQFINSVRELIREDQEKWVQSGMAFFKDQQESLVSNTKPRLRIVDGYIPCIDNNCFNDVRDALNDAMKETIKKDAMPYPKLLSVFEDFRFPPKCG